MRPKADRILQTVAMNLATRHVMTIQKDDDRTDMGLMVFVLGAVGEEFERAAHRRVEENRALRSLFADSLPMVLEEDLKRRLREASLETEEDFRISVLDKRNCELLELLIDLQAHVESMEGEEARKIEAAIWKELADYTKRREFKTWDISTRMIAAKRITDAREKLAAKKAGTPG